MFAKLITVLVLTFFAPDSGLGQQQPAPAQAAQVQEFPVTLEQTVTAGKTPVGTKIRAKLAVATLLDGKVIARNAILSGQVIESVAKTATNPSRLAIHVDSAQWKTGSASLGLYLTAWYYPTVNAQGQDLQYGPPQPASKTWNGEGQYPDPNSKVYRPFPGGDSNQGASVPDTPSSTTAKSRTLMKGVEPVSGDNGAIVLVSKRANIKLDKLTMYVLANGELLPSK